MNNNSFHKVSHMVFHRIFNMVFNRVFHSTRRLDRRVSRIDEACNLYSSINSYPVSRGKASTTQA